MRAPGSFGWADVGVLLSAVLWGFNFTAVKIALDGLPPLAIGLLRFVIATALLFAVLLIRERGARVARGDLARLFLMGALSIGVNQVLFLDGLHRTSAAIGSIMFACASAFTILLAMLLLGERAGRQIWVGILLATVGIALIVGVGAPGSAGAWTGELEVFASSLAVGLSSLLAKSLLRRYSAWRVTAWTALFGLCCLAPVAAGSLPAIHWAAVHGRAWAALAFIAVGASVVTLMLWNAGIARVGVTRATVYSYLQPILGVIFAAALLGDHLSAQQLAGGGVALVGTWLASAAAMPRAGRLALQTTPPGEPIPGTTAGGEQTTAAAN